VDGNSWPNLPVPRFPRGWVARYREWPVSGQLRSYRKHLYTASLTGRSRPNPEVRHYGQNVRSVLEKVVFGPSSRRPVDILLGKPQSEPGAAGWDSFLLSASLSVGGEAPVVSVRRSAMQPWDHPTRPSLARCTGCVLRGPVQSWTSDLWRGADGIVDRG
jgi:hypothetical protein